MIPRAGDRMRRAAAAAAVALLLAGAATAGCGVSARGAAGGDPRTAAATAATCPSRARGASLTAVHQVQSLDDQWSSYLASNTGWTGGDSAYAYKLPGHGTLWTFADSFIRGLVGMTHRKKLIYHNLFVVQGAGGYRLVTGGTPADPTALVEARLPQDFYLSLGGTVDGDVFEAIFMERLRTGPASLDNRPIGSVIATFSLPDLHLLRETPVPDPSGAIQWGAYVHRFGAYTYVYGASSGGLRKQAYVARVRGDDIVQPWSYWDGHGWSADPAAAVPILDGVEAEYGVVALDGMYVLLTSDVAAPFSNYADLWFGCSPEGPWLARSQFLVSYQVGTLGEAVFGTPRVYAYDSKPQPALGGGADDFVMSYDQNSLELPDLMRNAAIYDPAYLDLTIRPGPARSS